MKKILFAITKSNWGGAQRYVFDLATGLPKSEFDITVLLGGDGRLKTKLEESGVRVISFPFLGRDVSVKKEIVTFIKLFKILVKEKPDIVHLNSSKIGGIGGLAARLALRKKIIFTAHGWAFNEDRAFASKSTIYILYWITLFLSHKTIAVSNAVKDQVEHFPFVQKKILTIHNGIDPITFLTKEEAEKHLAACNVLFRQFLSTHTEKTILGTVSELHPIKGHSYAIIGFHKFLEKNPHSNMIFVIIGEGEERPKLEKLIEDLHLQEKVFLLGHVQDASLYLKAFDIFILSSLSEGLAYVLIEAGAAKLPVIASSVGGIPELITSMESGILVQPRNSKEISLAIAHLNEEPERREELAATLSEKISRHFSLKQMIERTISLYK